MKNQYLNCKKSTYSFISYAFIEDIKHLDHLE